MNHSICLQELKICPKCVEKFHCGHIHSIQKMEHGFTNLICTDNNVTGMGVKKTSHTNTTR